MAKIEVVDLVRFRKLVADTRKVMKDAEAITRAAGMVNIADALKATELRWNDELRAVGRPRIER